MLSLKKDEQTKKNLLLIILPSPTKHIGISLIENYVHFTSGCFAHLNAGLL